MKKLVVIAALAAMLLLVAWLLLSRDPVAERAAGTPELEASTDKVAPGTPALGTELSDVVPREGIAAADTLDPSISAPPSKTPTSRRAKFDPDANGWMRLIVQDPLGAPVVDALVRMTGLRSRRGPATGWAWIGEPSSSRTAADGGATLRYPSWIDADHPTSLVSFTIEHPEFMTLEVDGFAVDPTPRVIVLQHGAFLVVSGWFESPTERVLDVEPHMTWGAKVAPESWLPIKDGRLSCAIIPPGQHGLYLSHTSSERGLCFSDVAFFDIAPGEQKELHLKLLRGKRFEGRLGKAVPRPIANGRVLINLLVGTSEVSAALMSRELTAEVQADGSFVFESLPPGAAQIIGLCDGWASARVPDDLPPVDPRVESLSPEEKEKKMALMRDLALVPQSVDPGATDKPFELRMERTATVQATIVDSKKRPIAGVTLNFWPDVHWSNGYSANFMHLTYVGRSDEDGRVTVSNIPRGVVRGGAQHEHFVLPEDADGQRQLQVELAAGESREIRVVMEPREDE